MDAPHVCDHISMGSAKKEKVNHGRPPPSVVVSWDTNGWCNHLGLAVSFLQNQRLAYKLVDSL